MFKIKEGEIFFDMKLNMDKKSINQATQNTQKLYKSMSTNFLGSISAIKADIASLVATITGDVKDKNNQFKQTANSLNISIAEAQRLSYVQIYGDIGESLIQDLSKFSRKFADFQKNPSNNQELVKVFEQVGISNKDTNYDAYKKLVNSLNLTYAEYGDSAMPDIINALSKLGIRTNAENTQFYTKSGNYAFIKAKKEKIADDSKIRDFSGANETVNIQAQKDKFRLIKNLDSMELNYQTTLVKNTGAVSSAFVELTNSANKLTTAFNKILQGDYKGANQTIQSDKPKNTRLQQKSQNVVNNALNGGFLPSYKGNYILNRNS